MADMSFINEAEKKEFERMTYDEDEPMKLKSYFTDGRSVAVEAPREVVEHKEKFPDHDIQVMTQGEGKILFVVLCSCGETLYENEEAKACEFSKEQYRMFYETTKRLEAKFNG